MNEWVAKNRTRFYGLTNQIEEHHLKGGYGGDLDLSEIYIMMTELYKEIDSTEAKKDLALADLEVAKNRIKELDSKMNVPVGDANLTE